MRNAKFILSLVLCATLFTACSVDDINEDENTTQVEDVMATGDDENTSTETKGGS